MSERRRDRRGRARARRRGRARVGAAARRRRARAAPSPTDELPARRAARARRRRAALARAPAAGRRRGSRSSPGVELERRWVPLASVGIYVPRGLVSTLVMCAVPGAGRRRRADRRRARRRPAPGSSRRRRELLGLDEVWALGGPQAIARWLGVRPRAWTRSSGPGTRYVNEAKLLVSRDVAIDLPGRAVRGRRARRAGRRPRHRRARARGAGRARPGRRLPRRRVDGDLEAALAEVEELAPEHLVLLGDDAEALAPRVRNAGAVFVGPSSPVAAGDYATGGNHVLPTGGWARAVGGLGLETFLKPVTVQRLTRRGARARCARWSRRSRPSRACPRTRRRCGDEGAAAPDVRARTPGRRRPTSSRRRAGPRPRRRSSASTATCRRSRRPRRGPGTIAGALADVNEYAHGGYPQLVARDRATTRASSRRTSSSARARTT